VEQPETDADEVRRATSPVEPGWSVRRWPATVTLLLCIALYVLLPDRLILGPKWLVPALEALPIITLTFGHPVRHPGEPRWTRMFTILTIAIINIVNVASIVFLVEKLLHGTVDNGRELVYSAVAVWLTNCLIFGLWFWELDRGGPGVRNTVHEQLPDFQFPQMTDPRFAPKGWMPRFVDYLYVAFTNATAFSPTDAMPLTTAAKGLMAIESTASLVTVVVVAARAVNILQG
jgi:hypothetical protein